MGRVVSMLIAWLAKHMLNFGLDCLLTCHPFQPKDFVRYSVSCASRKQLTISIEVLLYSLFFVFLRQVLPCSQAGLELSDPLPSASPVWALQVNTTTPGCILKYICMNDEISLTGKLVCGKGKEGKFGNWEAS